jgi:hypothetical protein
MCSPTLYAEDNQINPSLEHANRLRVVGNFSIGIYNLQILNVSLVDEGLQGNLSQWNLHTWGYLQYDAAILIIIH